MIMDKEKCKEVIIRLNNYFNNSEPANIEFPSKVQYKSNEYYLYMFYSCLLDYGMKSKVYHRNLSETYMKYPQIFNPNYVLKMDEEELKVIIVNNIHPRYPNVATKKWLKLSTILKKYNDISNYLKEFKNFDELSCFIRSINGFGQKTGGLLIRIICDSKICNFEEEVKAIPIDTHDIEISYLTGIIDSKNISSSQIDDLSNTYVTIGNELNINPSGIDKYLWETGNTFCNKKNCDECPLNAICKTKT